MQTLGSFINKKTLNKGTRMDEKSVFYIFELIIKEEYGKQGAKNLAPASFRDKKLFINASKSSWGSEILLNKREIIEKLNKQLGGEEIMDLAISQ